MNQKVIYIAGPMTGIAEFNYPLFNETEVALFDLGYDVRNPANIDNMFPKKCGHPSDEMPAGCPWCTERDHSWYMRRCLPMLCEADGICVLPGWQDSKGARFEVECAQNFLGIPIDMVQFVDVWRRLAYQS